MRLCVRCKASEICLQLEVSQAVTDRVTSTVCTAWARAASDAIPRSTIEQFMRDNFGPNGYLKAMMVAGTRESLLMGAVDPEWIPADVRTPLHQLFLPRICTRVRA